LLLCLCKGAEEHGYDQNERKFSHLLELGLENYRKISKKRVLLFPKVSGRLRHLIVEVSGGDLTGG
jgi:hypothetical protein